MRVVTRNLLRAARTLAPGKSRRVGNSSVEVNPDQSIVFRLHGHSILDVSPEGEVSVSLAGWPTVTTRSRLNDLLFGLGVDAGLFQHRREQFIRLAGQSEEMHSENWRLAGRLDLAAFRSEARS